MTMNIVRHFARNCCRRGGCCRRLPSFQEICSVLGMARCPMNTPLSSIGEKQVRPILIPCLPYSVCLVKVAGAPTSKLSSSCLSPTSTGLHATRPGGGAAEESDRRGQIYLYTTATAAGAFATGSGPGHRRRALWQGGECRSRTPAQALLFFCCVVQSYNESHLCRKGLWRCISTRVYTRRAGSLHGCDALSCSRRAALGCDCLACACCVAARLLAAETCQSESSNSRSGCSRVRRSG